MALPASPAVENRHSPAAVSAIAAVAVGAWVAAAALRFGHSLTVDEPFMANVVRGGWRDITPVFAGDNVPLGYALLWSWTRLFGESEFALRSLSMTAFAGAVFLTGLAARQAAGAAAGVVAAILAAASVNIGLTHASNARPYALLCCMAAAATWISLVIIRRPTNTRASALTRSGVLLVIHLLGLFTHPTYALFLTALILASLWVPRDARLSLLAAGVTAVAIYLVLWWPVLRGTFEAGATRWMASAAWLDVPYAGMLIWGTGRGAVLLGAVLVLALATPAAASRLFKAPVARWMLMTAMLGWLVPLAVSLWQPVFFPGRTPVLLLPATAAALSIVIVPLASRPALVALCAVVASGPLITLAGGFGIRDPTPTRSSVATVLERAACGDIVVAAGLSYDGVSFYLRQLDTRRCLLARPYPGDVRILNAATDTAERLRERARTLAAELIGQRSAVWAFLATRGFGAEASEMLAAELRRTMACAEVMPLSGAAFNQVMACRPH